MHYKRDKSETTILLKQAQDKIKTLENNMNSNTENNDENMAQIIIENERLKRENKELQYRLKLLTSTHNALPDKNDTKALLRQNADLKEQVEDAKTKIAALNAEIKALEANLEHQEKIISSKSEKSDGFTGIKSTAQEELEYEIRNLRQLLQKSENDKSELFQKFKLYDLELSKQEAFFQEEIRKLKSELEKEKKKPENMENTLIDDLLDRFSDIQEKIKTEKGKYEKEMHNAMKMAENVYLLKNILIFP